MTKQITLSPIGTVHSPVRKPVDDVWGGLISRIELDETRFTPASLTGLNEYSHVEVVFALHKLGDSEVHYGLRHPRGRDDWPEVGIFAQRAKNRPNRLGVTICRLLSIKELSIEVEGLDAIDGTPVLDIKPYLAEFGPKGTVLQPAWSKELMSVYWNKSK